MNLVAVQTRPINGKHAYVLHGRMWQYNIRQNAGHEHTFETSAICVRYERVTGLIDHWIRRKIVSNAQAPDYRVEQL